jgi:hypothetical protein
MIAGIRAEAEVFARRSGDEEFVMLVDCLLRRRT